MNKTYRRITILSLLLILTPGLFAGPPELFQAIGDLSLDRISRELRSGTDVNCADEEGNAPLHRAVDGGSLPVVKLLLASGARSNARNIWGTTPLHLACRYGHTDIVKALTVAGAGVNPVDINGDTPLALAEKTARGRASAAFLEGIGAKRKRRARFDGQPFFTEAVAPGDGRSETADKILDRMKDYLREHGDEYIDFPVFMYPAELDGNVSSTEAVAFGSRYIGEGHSASGCLAYDGDAVLAAEIQAYPYENGFVDITDLDDDGVNEIMAVGSTHDMQRTELSVYTVKGGVFQDLIWGFDFGIAYFHYDINGDGVEEIIGVGGEGSTGNSLAVSAVRMGAKGLYRPCAPSEDIVDALVWLLEKGVMEERRDWFVRHGGEDIPMLTDAVKKQGRAPRDLEGFQAKLERLYVALPLPGKKAALSAMAFEGNTAAVPFLKNVIQRDEDADVKEAAIAALAAAAGPGAGGFLLARLERILAKADGSGSLSYPDGGLLIKLVQTPLAWGDRRGLDQVSRYALAEKTPPPVRGDLTWRVLSHRLPDTAEVLCRLAIGSWDEHTRRGAVNALASQDEEIIRVVGTPFWLKLLDDTNPDLRGQAALALSRKKDAELVPVLLRGLEKEPAAGARRAFIHALSELNALFPKSFRQPAVEAVFLKQLRAETDNDNISALLRLTAAALDGTTINDVLRKAQGRNVLETALNIVRDRRLIAAAPAVMELVDRQTDHFVPEIAVETLGALDTPAVRERLRGLLYSPTDMLRGRAAVSLGMVRDMTAEQRIIDMLLFDEDEFARKMAGRALGLLGTLRAKTLLLSSLRRGLQEDYGYIESLDPLQGDPQVLDALAEEMNFQAVELKDHNVDSRKAVKLAEYLYKKNDPRGWQALCRWAAGETGSLEMQLKALESLDGLGVKTRVTLPASLTEHENREVRVRALTILAGQQPSAP